MAVGVDQAGDQRPAAPVEQEARPLRPAVAALEQLPHPPVVADPQAVEAEQPPVLAHRVAVDIVDQHVGERRGGDRAGRRGARMSLRSMAAAIRLVCAPRQMV